MYEIVASFKAYFTKIFLCLHTIKHIVNRKKYLLVKFCHWNGLGAQKVEEPESDL